MQLRQDGLFPSLTGGEVPYEGNHPYPEEKTLAQLQNRWDRHVSICKQCQQVGAWRCASACCMLLQRHTAVSRTSRGVASFAESSARYLVS